MARDFSAELFDAPAQTDTGQDFSSELFPDNAPGSVVDQIGAGFKEARASMATKDAVDAIEMAKTLGGEEAQQGATEYATRKLRRANDLLNEASTVRNSPSTDALLNAKSFGEAWDSFWKAPVTAIKEIGARSASGSVTALAPAIAGGAIAGPAGFVAGTGLGSGSIEYTTSIRDGLINEGIDIADPNAVMKAAADPVLMERVKKYALTRAAIIGSVDAATGGLEGKVLAPAMRSPLAREATNLVAQGGAQAVGGATGEAGAELATTGEIQPGQVAAEAAGEFVTAPVEVAGAAMSGVREHANTKTAPRDFSAELFGLPAPAPFAVSPDGTVNTGTAPAAETPPVDADAVARQHPAYPNETPVPVPALPAPAAIPVTPEGQAILPGQQEEIAAQQQQQQAEQVAAQHPGYARETPVQLQPSPIDSMEPLDISQRYAAPAPRPDINSLNPIDSQGNEIRGGDALQPAPDNQNPIKSEPVSAAGSIAPAPTANQEPPTRAQKMRSIEASRDDILTAIAKSGGLSRADAEAQGIDPASFKSRRGILPIFTKGGQSLDQMAETLSQHGYLPSDGYTANALLDKVTTALSGKFVGTPDGHVEHARRQQADTEIARALEHNDDATLAQHAQSDQHLPDASPSTRLLTDKLIEAMHAGVSPSRINSFIDEHDTDSEAFSKIGKLIEEAQNGEADRQRTAAQKLGAQNETGSEEISLGQGTHSNDLTDEEIDRLFGIATKPAEPKKQTSAPTDLFGAIPVTQQSIADRQRELDNKRNGTRDVPADIDGGLFSNQSKQTDIESAAHEAATSPLNDLPQPTDAQKEAGNYKKGHVSVHGLDITIENPRGSERTGKREDGSAWSHTMSDHYGYIKRTEGADGEQVDVYVGPNPESEKVFVVDQINQKTGGFDEHKVMLGFSNRIKAVNAYKSNFDKGWKVGPITEMSIDNFKDWLKGDTKNPIEKAISKNIDIKRPEKIDDLGEKIGGARKDTAVSGGSRASRIKEDDEAGWRKRYIPLQIVLEGPTKGKWHLADKRKKGRFGGVARVSGEVYDTEADALAAIPLAEVARNHRVAYTRGADGNNIYYIARDVSDRKRVRVVAQNFDSREAALEYMAKHAVEIIETKTNFGEEILPRPETVNRTGAEHRTGDVKGDDFMSQFGFRGVEFGNWNNQEERQIVMNHAYDGLMDLADVLGVPPRALSLNGDLALAFGARGQGLSGARAHYERSYGVINLTKMSGAGSLAHEFAHALDHYLGRLDGKAGRVENPEPGSPIFKQKDLENDYASHGFSTGKKYQMVDGQYQSTGEDKSGARAELRDAWDRVIKTMTVKAEQYVEDAAKAEHFVGKVRNDLEQRIANLRADLAEQRDEKYWKKFAKPATDAQLKEFDELAAKLVNDAPELQEMRAESTKGRGFRMTNDTLNAISAIVKKVRNRSGFGSGDTHGPLDYLRSEVRSYHTRLKMLESAAAEETKTKTVPTTFLMDAKDIDQGRASDYWSTRHELVARAFESYVQDKIGEQGNTSDFLVYGTSGSIPTPWGFAKPYPAGAERVAIDNAFDKFFEEVKTKETDSGIAMFSRRDNRNAAARENGPISKTDAHGVIARFNAGRRLGDNGDIRLVESFSDLPAPIQKAAYDEGAHPDEIEGVFHNGAVYLVRDRHANEVDLERTLFHEAYGHYGLRGLFGKAITQKMNQLYAAIGGSKGFVELATRYGVDLKDYAAGLHGSEIDVRNAILTEELLAHIAQDQRPSLARKASEIIGAIRAWLREHGLAALSKIKDSDIMYLLKRARRVVETGSGIGEGTRFLFGENSPMFSRRKSSEPDPWTADTDTERAALHKLGLGATRRRSIAETIQEFKNFEWRAAIDELKQRQYEGWIDGLAGLRRAEQDLSKGIAAGDYQNSPYVGASLATGIADVMHAVTYYGAPEWKDGVLQYKAGTRGLMEILGELKGDDLTKWLGWMGGNRARELMAQGRENNLTEPEIKTLINMAKGNEGKFERVRREYLAINNAMLDVAQEAGLINADNRKAWQSDWYVPFYRTEEADNGEVSLLAPRTKRGLSHQKSGIQQLIGGTSATNDLLSNILHNWLKLTDASMKNSAMLKTVDMLRGTDYMTAAEQDLADKEIVRVMRDGKPEYYRVNDPAVLRATQHLGMRGSDSSLMQAGRWFKRLLTTGVTAAPDFILRNFIRDAAQAWAISPDGFNFGRDSLRGLQTAFREDPAYRELMFAGASFQGGYIHGSDPEAAAQMIRRALKAKGYGDGEIKGFLDSTILTAGQAWSALQKGWEHYREIGDKVENSNRVATYMRALDAGKSNAQAAFEAKDLMDFSRRGNFKALVALTDVIPFLNARVQGLDKLARTGLKSNKSRMIFAGNMAKIVAWSMLLAWLNKDDERYKMLPDWDKDAYWHLFIGDQHFRLPKPFEIGLIAGTIPERMLNAWAFGTQTTKTLIDSVMRNLYGTLNINPIPQAALPAFEALYMNKSIFFQTPIENEHDQKVLPAERYDANTSETMKKLGGASGMSPKKLQYLWEGYTGSIGAYALAATDMLVREASGAPPRPSLEAVDIPLVKSFYRGSEPPRSTQYTTDLYDRLQEVNQIIGSVKKMQQEGDIDGARKLISENQSKIASRGPLESGSEALSALRKRQVAIMRDRTMTPDQKRAELNTIIARMNDISGRVSRNTEQAFSN